jgi:hypothetical protein
VRPRKPVLGDGRGYHIGWSSELIVPGGNQQYMSESSRECSYVHKENIKCRLPATADGLCIGHSSELGKGIDDFDSTLRYCLSMPENGVVNLSGFVFPPLANLPQHIPEDVDTLIVEGCTFWGPCQWKDRAIKAVIRFDGSDFRDEAAFSRVQFETHASFKGTRFRSDFNVSESSCRNGIQFDKAIFEGKVSWLKVSVNDTLTFLECQFFQSACFEQLEVARDCLFTSSHWYAPSCITGSLFRSKLNFNKAILNGLNTDKTRFSSVMSFEETQFLGETVLSRHQMSSAPPDVSFKGANMSHCIFKVVSADKLEGLDFLGVNWSVTRTRPRWITAKWPGWSKWLTRILPNKYYQFKSIEPREQEVLMRIYEQYYESKLRFREAGLFYVRSMETLLRLEWKEKRPFNWLFNMLYGLLSRYGESVARPSLWAIILFGFCTLALHFGGIRAEAGSQATTGFLQSLQISFSLLAPGKVSAADYLRAPWQLALLSAEIFALATVVGFLIAALRRRFKRRGVGQPL